MRDLLSDLNNYTPDPQTSDRHNASDTVNDVIALPLASAGLSKL